MKTTIEQLRKANWDDVENEVIVKLRLLRKTAEKLEPSPLNDKIANDLILPCLALLGRFCESVTIEDD